jgi:hypothetical protein
MDWKAATMSAIKKTLLTTKIQTNIMLVTKLFIPIKKCVKVRNYINVITFFIPIKFLMVR